MARSVQTVRDCRYDSLYEREKEERAKEMKRKCMNCGERLGNSEPRYLVFKLQFGKYFLKQRLCEDCAVLKQLK